MNKFSRWTKKTILTVSLITILMIAILITVDNIYGADPGGSWVYVSTRTAVYNITASTDDVWCEIEGLYSADSNQITVREPYYDTRFGFRFDISDSVWNSTHREFVDPGNAYLEVYSDFSHFAGDLSGLLSIYMINQSTVGTFQNYTDFVSRPNHYFLGTTQISNFGRVGASGFEYRDFTSSMLHNGLNIMNEYAFTDNDTLGMVFQTTKGQEVYFWSYDDDPTHPPRLVVQWDLFEWIDVEEPTGYSGSTFIEEPEEGIFIWSFNGSNAGWINYDDYTLFNVSGGEDFTVSTNEITGYRITVASTDDFRLQRANPSNQGFILMSVNITEVSDSNAGFDNTAHFFGHATANKNVFNIDNDLHKGVFLGICTINNNTDSIFSFCINTHNAGVWNIKRGNEYNITRYPRRYYLNITYDYPNQDFICRVYDSFLFDNLLENLNRTGYANIANAYGNEFAFNTESRGTHADYASFNTIVHSGITFVVADENGTVIDTFPNLEDARDFVDWYTSAANPTYDALPNLGNTIIAIMGIMGLIMIPGSFIMFGHCTRSGDWVQGFYYLLVMFFVGLGFVTVWLFG